LSPSRFRLVCPACTRGAEPAALGRCPDCGAVLSPLYSDAALREITGIAPGPGIDRYRALLPVDAPIPFLGEGDTPLIRSARLGRALGVEDLWFKVEARNPTGSFKDRAGALAAALALQAGARGVVTASSGNAAAAVATYAAAVGLGCLVLLEPGNPADKVRQTVATGARLLPVTGLFSHGPEALSTLLRSVAARRGDYLAFVWAPINPSLVEAMKTISYEIAARLPGPPDLVVCPTGGGDLLAGQWRGWRELHRANVIDRLPRVIAVQSDRAAPLVAAFEAGAERVAPLTSAHSSFSGINVAFSGEHALAAVRESAGAAVAVDEERVYELQRRLAREEGVSVEAASAAPLAALDVRRTRGLLRSGQRVVCVLTGAGFKDARLGAAQGLSEAVPFDADAIARSA
jgi:threonine synthase